MHILQHENINYMVNIVIFIPVEIYSSCGAFGMWPVPHYVFIFSYTMQFSFHQHSAFSFGKYEYFNGY